MRQKNWNLFILMVVAFLFMLTILDAAADPHLGRGANPAHDEYHEWYKTLYMKERGYQHISCCDDQDCQPVKFLGWDKDGNPKLLTRYGPLTAPFDKIQIQPSPDQGWHACLMAYPDGHGNIENYIMWYCVIAPEGNG